MYSIREFAVYGRRGGIVRRSWQVVKDDNGAVVYNGGKKRAEKLCEKWNNEQKGGMK